MLPLDPTFDWPFPIAELLSSTVNSSAATVTVAGGGLPTVTAKVGVARSGSVLLYVNNSGNAAIRIQPIFPELLPAAACITIVSGAAGRSGTVLPCIASNNRGARQPRPPRGGDGGGSSGGDRDTYFLDHVGPFERVVYMLPPQWDGVLTNPSLGAGGGVVLPGGQQPRDLPTMATTFDLKQALLRPRGKCTWQWQVDATPSNLPFTATVNASDFLIVTRKTTTSCGSANITLKAVANNCTGAVLRRGPDESSAGFTVAITVLVTAVGTLGTVIVLRDRYSATFPNKNPTIYFSGLLGRGVGCEPTRAALIAAGSYVVYALHCILTKHATDDVTSGKRSEPVDQRQLLDSSASKCAAKYNFWMEHIHVGGHVCSCANNGSVV